jgi:hypothetical protein
VSLAGVTRFFTLAPLRKTLDSDSDSEDLGEALVPLPLPLLLSQVSSRPLLQPLIQTLILMMTAKGPGSLSESDREAGCLSGFSLL